MSALMFVRSNVLREGMRNFLSVDTELEKEDFVMYKH